MFKDYKTGGYNLESAKANETRLNNDSTQLGGVVRGLCPRTTPQHFVRSVFFLLKYSSVPKGKFSSIYSFQLACHPVSLVTLIFLYFQY